MKRPTPEEAGAELERRKAMRQQSQRLPTPEEAGAELERRRGLQSQNQQPQGWQNSAPLAAVEGFNQSVGKYPLGLIQMFAPEAAQKVAQQRQQGLDQQRQNNPNAVGIGQFLGDMAIGAPVFGGGAVGGSLARRALLSAFSGALGAGTLAGAKYVEPGRTRGQNAVEGAEFGGLVGGSTPYAAKALGALPGALKGIPSIPERFVAGRYGKGISPENLEANLRATEGTDTSLGNVIESPILRRAHENLIPRVPMGPGYAGFQKIANQVEDRGKSLFNKLGDKVPSGEDPNFALRKTLEGAHEKQRTIKNELYKPVNELAKKEGFALDLNGFNKKASEIDKLLKNSVLRTNPSLDSLYNKARNLMGKDVPSLVEAKTLAQTLESEKNNLASSSVGAERSTAKQIDELAKALRADIKKSVETKGSQELKNALSKADENYSKNYSQWLDNLDLIAEKKDPQDLARKIMEGGKAGDKFSRIQKIQNLLPEDQRNVIGYAYLQKALDNEGNFRAAPLRNALSQLGKRQFKALFPDNKIRQELHDFSRLGRLNEAALRPMQNPPTGVTALDIIVAGGGLLTNGISGATAPFLAKAGLAHGLNKVLQSPGFRKKVADQIKMRHAKTFAQGAKAEGAVASPLEASLMKAFAKSPAALNEKRKKE